MFLASNPVASPWQPNLCTSTTSLWRCDVSGGGVTNGVTG